MGISQTTAELYGRHAKRFARWIDANGHDADAPEVWVTALQALAGGLAKKSWRLYRNAITWHLGEARGPAFRAAFLIASDAVQKPPERRRRLLRRLDPKTLRTVVIGLMARRGRTGGRIAEMLIAMVATGIRPNEWQSVTRSGPMLTVVNAKFQPPDGTRPGRGNGPTRELVLDRRVAGTPTEDAIEGTIDWLRGRPWRTVSPNANRLFRSTVAALVKSRSLAAEWNRLRIYDARHQFSANAKASLSLLAGEVAAAMGHASVVTAITHYGKRQHATGSSQVMPSMRSVRGVSPASITRAKAGIQRTQAALARAARSQQDANGAGARPGDRNEPRR